MARLLDKNKISLGIAPIGWTNDDMPELGKENTFEQCISEMALAGFTGSEVGSQYPKEPATLKKYLAIRGLQICNAWFSTFFTTGEQAQTEAAFIKHRDFLFACGAKVIGCSEQGGSIQGKAVPIFGEKPVFSDDQWNRLAHGMDRLAELASEKDMRVCLHHHMGTGIQTPAEIDRFMDAVSPQVYLLFDTGHIYFSEGDQAAVDDLADKYINRIIHVHLKDVRPDVLRRVRDENLSFLDGVRAGVFTVPGDGGLNFDHVFDTLRTKNYRGWMVVEAEQDPAVANPFAYAVKARAFIREKTGL